MNTLNITPTWEGLVPAFLALIENGDAKGRAFAIAEITRMATIADAAVARDKADAKENAEAAAYENHMQKTEC